MPSEPLFPYGRAAVGQICGRGRRRDTGLGDEDNVAALTEERGVPKVRHPLFPRAKSLMPEKMHKGGQIQRHDSWGQRGLATWVGITTGPTATSSLARIQPSPFLDDHLVLLTDHGVEKDRHTNSQLAVRQQHNSSRGEEVTQLQRANDD